MSRFDAEIAEQVGLATCAPLSDAGRRPPTVLFEVMSEGRRMIARPDGALISCEWGDRGPYVSIRANDREHIAEVMVCVPLSEDDTAETIAIASALYWSWWRAKDMRGEPLPPNGDGTKEGA